MFDDAANLVNNPHYRGLGWHSFLNSPLTCDPEISVRTEAMTQEIHQRIDELARKDVETHDPEMPQELYRLSRELEKIMKE